MWRFSKNRRMQQKHTLLLRHTLQWLAAATLACGTAQAAVPQAQTDWLADLYTSTQGASWTNRTNWLTGDPCDNNWFGITCNAGKTSVTIINLGSNNLQGSLPATPAWSQIFPDLEKINLVSNKLGGTFPALTGFSHLTGVYLSGNSLFGGPGFSGSLPDVSGLPELTEFYAVANAFTGTLPAMSNLPKLKIFWAGQNQLTGSVPDLSGLPALEEFAVSGNQLGGVILGTLPASLQAFLVYDNQLTGPVPAAPAGLLAGASKLCGNHLEATASPAWNAATGQAQWWTGCTYVITPSAGANGAISPAQTVAVNAQPTFIATPAQDYLLDAFGGTCGGVAAGNNFQIAPATHNCTVTASFLRDPAAPPLPDAATAVPTLGEWALALLALLVGATAFLKKNNV